MISRPCAKCQYRYWDNLINRPCCHLECMTYDADMDNDNPDQGVE